MYEHQRELLNEDEVSCQSGLCCNFATKERLTKLFNYVLVQGMNICIIILVWAAVEGQQTLCNEQNRKCKPYAPLKSDQSISKDLNLDTFGRRKHRLPIFVRNLMLVCNKCTSIHLQNQLNGFYYWSHPI